MVSYSSDDLSVKLKMRSDEHLQIRNEMKWAYSTWKWYKYIFCELIFVGCAMFKARLGISRVSICSPDARFSKWDSTSQEFQDIRRMRDFQIHTRHLRNFKIFARFSKWDSAFQDCQDVRRINRIILVRELEKDQEPFAVCAELFGFFKIISNLEES